MDDLAFSKTAAQCLLMIMMAVSLLGCSQSSENVDGANTTEVSVPLGGSLADLRASPMPTPTAPAVEARVSASPATAEPGQVVRLALPSELMRGIGFYLEAQRDGTWTPVYCLTEADYWEGYPSPPPLNVPYSEHCGWEALGVAGSALVKMPEGIPPGSYRVCTASADTRTCAQVDVTDA